MSVAYNLKDTKYNPELLLLTRSLTQSWRELKWELFLHTGYVKLALYLVPPFVIPI